MYALAGPGVSRRLPADRRRTLRTLDVGGISVIFENRSRGPETTAEALRQQHAIVTRLAASVDALLPVRFGTLCSRSELEARVRAAHDVIREALDRVHGRVQMTVRLYSEPAPLSTGTRFSSGTAYLRAHRDRERAVRRQCTKLARTVSRFVVEERIEPGKGTVRATMYHLINAADVDRYRAALAKAAASLAPDTIAVTGPWPVFAFVPELRRG